MMIKKLQLNNFGIYAGENTFDFSLKKPIVLIGGMNGRGKTTFLEAIVLSLYGNNSTMFKESRYKSYGQYLRSLVNRDSWTQQASVELTFVVNDGIATEYIIHREWDAKSKTVSDIITVSENGIYNRFLTENWSMFIENIIPSALADFYFFDGEKIADLALDEKNAQLRDSIRAMLGLNVLDVLRNDLNKTLRKRSANRAVSVSQSNIQQLKQQQEALAKSIAMQEANAQEIQVQVARLQEEIAKLQHDRDAKGGIAVEQHDNLICERAELTTALDQVQADQLNTAASELPLLLVRNLIQEIKLQVEDEHDDIIMSELVERVDLLLEEYLQQGNHDTEESRKFVDYIKHRSASTALQPIYQVSEFARFQLNNLLDGVLLHTKQTTIELLTKKKNLQKEIGEVESHLSLDINEDELSQISAAIKTKQDLLIDLQVNLNSKVQEIDVLKAALAKKNDDVKTAVDTYLKEASIADETARMDQYTHMALKILDAYSVEVQSRKCELLSSTITGCYHKLANKQQLINHISVDAETLELAYLDQSNIQIPSNKLSAGEKQLMVISVLWALAICSKKKLPVIIDTPLSRLDSAHRASVIQHYFPNASDQTMILSTDSEIDNAYYKLMEDSVGDKFTLKYDEATRSTSIVKGYFAA